MTSFQLMDENLLRIIVLFSSADDSLVKILLAHFYFLPKKELVCPRGCQNMMIVKEKSQWNKINVVKSNDFKAASVQVCCEFAELTLCVSNILTNIQRLGNALFV